MEDEDMLDETASPEAEALLDKYPDLAGMSPADVYSTLTSRYLGAMKSEDAARKAAEASQAARFKAATAEIEKKRYGEPTTSEKLYALSAALLSPRNMPGIAGTLNNIVPALNQMSQLQRSAEEQRAEARAKLAQETAMAREQSLLSRAEGERKSFGELLRFYAPLAKPQGMGQWSESLGRFIPKDRAVPVASGKLPDGRRIDKMSDGSMRALNNDGSYSYYDAAGNPINVGGQ